MASGPCARPLPAPGVPSSNPAFHTSERAAREGEGPTQGHPPTKEWSGQRERWLKLGVEQPGFQSQHCRQLAAKPRVSYPATLSLGFPVRKQLISVKNAPFHPRGTLAGKQPGRMAALLGSAKSQLPSALLRSPLAPRWAREGSVQARRRQGGRRGLPDCAQGCEKPSRPQRAGGTPGRPSLPSPPDPCRAGTQGPAVRLPPPRGLVLERLQRQQRGRPATGNPRAPGPQRPGEPRGGGGCGWLGEPGPHPLEQLRWVGSPGRPGAGTEGGRTPPSPRPRKCLPSPGSRGSKSHQPSPEAGQRQRGRGVERPVRVGGRLPGASRCHARGWPSCVMLRHPGDVHSGLAHMGSVGATWGACHMRPGDHPQSSGRVWVFPLWGACILGEHVVLTHHGRPLSPIQKSRDSNSWTPQIQV